MKTKLQLSTLAAVLFLLSFVCVAAAQNAFHTSGAVDPTTGLPVLPEWKDKDWNDPEKILAEVNYDGLPISVVAQNLHEQFKSEFDVLLPQDYGTGHSDIENFDWSSSPVHLRLEKVTASEVFNAMNMLFENNHQPVRWELRMNGNRRTVLLRVLEDPKPVTAATKPQIRRVYFVGDLIGNDKVGNDKTGGMSTSDVVNTVTQVWQMAYGHSGAIQFHEKAQLLIVTGSEDEIAFIQQTIEALRVKAQVDNGRRHVTESNSKNDEPKTSAGGGGGK